MSVRQEVKELMVVVMSLKKVGVLALDASLGKLYLRLASSFRLPCESQAGGQNPPNKAESIKFCSIAE